MNSNSRKLALGLAVAATLAAPSAFATNGYFSHGYGMKGSGMGGVSTAMTHDTFGGANNPATMVWVGNRMDIGASWFNPERSASRSGSSMGLNGSSESDSTGFLVPEFGYNKMLNPNMSFGVTVYGNGGMNTDYPNAPINAGVCSGLSFTGAAGPYNLLCGTGNLGVDLMQLIIAPTWSYKLNENNSVGVSPLIAYQRFKAEGLQGFANFATDSTKLTNNGYDTSTGFGVRFGWYGKMSDTVSLGAAYSTKIAMSKFDKYASLFAEQGDFDIPSNFNLGLAFKISPTMLLGVDYQKIKYTDVKSVSNSSANGGSTMANTLGGADGRGFGWTDIDVWKIGVQYQHSDRLTIRAGIDRTDNPIRPADVTFNILAPGVVTNHYSVGFTMAMDKNTEITGAYTYVAEKKVSGSSLYATWLGAAGGGTEEIKMHQNIIGLSWSTKW
ncbi:MAG: long-chain fatty acid transporter [Candidatus Muproteobacteria bacterium RBG_16_62_13]|uniref:Long-chain fatty acid transporter n=1 Tax=Candidatus Muproteobacteria bacterium RBG_16_62_13 TaxID=1817756 RepID=A0A1F6T996_9PROT|nr:MAG: long-chain fatty acid transporter [Candidatus Muproteobacteria bacterium RBG_16_62_13]